MVLVVINDASSEPRTKISQRDVLVIPHLATRGHKQHTDLLVSSFQVGYPKPDIVSCALVLSPFFFF